MTKVGLIKFLILFFFVSGTSYAQKKVKYKDVFNLLSTKQYEEAEPFLKKYLKDENDNPNAFLYMGVIYQEKSSRYDILKETDKAVNDIDSSIFFLNKAHATITERELKKNDEFYQNYKRRDLRTGEFGVKLADIQFDIEKKVEGLTDQRKRLIDTKSNFTSAEEYYQKCNTIFTALQESYRNEKIFFLRSDTKSVSALKDIKMIFDSAIYFFDEYQKGVKKLGTNQYNQKVELQPIKDFKQDGKSKADLYQNLVKLWDYKSFADNHQDIISKEINPMRDQLVSIDNQLNELRDKFNSDSISVNPEIKEVQVKINQLPILKYDERPLPLDIFFMKMKDLEYKSALVEHKDSRDSADVHFQWALVNKELMIVEKLDSVVNRLSETDLNEEILNYRHYITTVYQNDVILSSYFKAVKNFAEKEIVRLREKETDCRNALNWLITEKDTIPLSLGKNHPSCLPLCVEKEKYTAGITLGEANRKGYFYSITPSRHPDLSVNFSIEGKEFVAENDASLKGVVHNSDDQIYFVLLYHNELKEGKLSAIIAKIYRSDGLSWKNVYSLDFIPDSLEYVKDTGLLSVKNSQKLVTVDKNGKMK